MRWYIDGELEGIDIDHADSSKSLSIGGDNCWVGVYSSSGKILGANEMCWGWPQRKRAHKGAKEPVGVDVWCMCVVVEGSGVQERACFQVVGM